MMDTSLRISIFLVGLLLLLVNIQLLRRGRIPVKFSLLWGIGIVVIFSICIIPSGMGFFAEILGFTTISNMVIGILIVILFFLTISLTVIVSGQKTKIQLLIQELSMMKQKINDQSDK